MYMQPVVAVEEQVYLDKVLTVLVVLEVFLHQVRPTKGVLEVVEVLAVELERKANTPMEELMAVVVVGIPMDITPIQVEQLELFGREIPEDSHQLV
jgi:hypothetical protein